MAMIAAPNPSLALPSTNGHALNSRSPQVIEIPISDMGDLGNGCCLQFSPHIGNGGHQPYASQDDYQGSPPRQCKGEADHHLGGMFSSKNKVFGPEGSKREEKNQPYGRSALWFKLGNISGYQDSVVTKESSSAENKVLLGYSDDICAPPEPGDMEDHENTVPIPEEYQTNGHGGHEDHQHHNHHNGKDESGEMLDKMNNAGVVLEGLHDLCVAFPPGFSHSPPSGGDEANTSNAPAVAATDGAESTGCTSNRSLPSTPRPNGNEMAKKRGVMKAGVGGGGMADMNVEETVQQQQQPDHTVSGKLARAGQEGLHVCSTPVAAHLKECKEEEPPASLSPSNLGGKSKCGRPRPVMGEYDQEHAANSSSPRQQSHILLTISTPPLSAAHHDQGEVVTYQAQLPSNRYVVPDNGEAQDQQPRWKDFSCQLPECVISRANAKSAGISPAGGAQMEHLLARVKQEKTASRARAWEESAKCKAFNRYSRDESKITAWENTMKAKAEARLRRAQEDLDRQRAKHVEKMKNSVANAHRAAEEMRAAMEARKAEEIVKAEEVASRIRATGKMPRRCLCLSA